MRTTRTLAPDDFFILPRAWHVRAWCGAASRIRARRRVSIKVKPSDRRTEKYVEQYGNRCWEADVLSEDTIQTALDDDIGSWLDRTKWDRRGAEVEKARTVL
jgi:hypothetical protein